MSEQKTVTIKGVVYDIATGQPLHKARTRVTSAHAVHVKTKQPTQLVRKKAPTTPTQVTTHPAVSKFAPHPTAKPVKKSLDIAPVSHPTVTKAHSAAIAKNQKRVVKPSSVIKQEAIRDAMERTPSKPRKQLKLKKERTKINRFARTATAALALMLLGGYLTYLNMPALSTRIASSQAGINAKYPSYSPSGYSLSGPVTYTNGMVSMKFAANAGPRDYTITESRSSWDSTAVRENQVQPTAGDNFDTLQANGLTIYTYDSKAAWVNGGILYTIESNANLSPDQIKRIAVSM